MMSDRTHVASHNALFAVDTAALDGPRTNGDVILGRAIAKDTVAVSGITLRFRVGDMSAGADDPQFSYVVRIIDDRMVPDKP
jgi:hypothetical protein